MLTSIEAKLLILDSILGNENLSLGAFDIFNNALNSLSDQYGNEYDAYCFICRYHGIKPDFW